MVASPANCWRPANPSSAAWSPPFSIRSASGDSDSICRHQATVSASRSASGTTWFTRPQSRAVAASYCRHRNHTSFARLRPMVRASRLAPYPPSKLPTLGPGLTEPGVVGGDGQVADQVQDVTTADGVTGHHGHHRLREAPDLDLEVEDVEATDALAGHGVVPEIAVVAPDLLITSRAERVRTLPGQDDDTDRRVVPGGVEGVGQFEEGLGPEGVADLGSGDGELGQSVGHVVVDVPVVRPGVPTRAADGLGTCRRGRPADR